MNSKLNINIIYCIICLIIAGLFFSCGKEQSEKDKKLLDIYKSRTLGLAYLEENMLDDSETEFLKFINLAPDEPLGYANLGLVYLRMGRYGDAEKQVQIALEKDLQNANIRLIMATIYEYSRRYDEALKILEGTLKYHPEHVRTHYKIARILLQSKNKDKYLDAIVEHLNIVLKFRPANIVARLQLIETFIYLNNSDQAILHLEELRRQVPDLMQDTLTEYSVVLSLLRDSKTKEALVPAITMHNLLKTTALYQAGTMYLIGPGGTHIGFPVTQLSQTLAQQKMEISSSEELIKFIDISSEVGLDIFDDAFPAPPTSQLVCNIAIGDYDGDDDSDIFICSWDIDGEEQGNTLMRNDRGHYTNVTAESGLNYFGKSLSASFADYDNDGKLDLFVCNDGPNLLYRNMGEGKFTNVSEKIILPESATTRSALFADFDHEGDLDIYLTNSTVNNLLRNNFDGTFTELATKVGLDGGAVSSKDAAIGDFDEDGDIDLLLVNDKTSNILYTNLRQGYFEDITSESNLVTGGGSGAVAVGDYNNDGFSDLFITGISGGNFSLYLNKQDGTFKEDSQSIQNFQELEKINGLDADFLDFNNDGYLDLLVVGFSPEDSINKRGVFLFKNDGSGKFEDVSSILPSSLLSGRGSVIGDYDADGDVDIFISGLGGKIYLLRNDGGNVNNWLAISVMGLSGESGKNNLHGIGAKLEVRAGDLYQMRVISSPVTYFGIGDFSEIDVARVLWTNGIPQHYFKPEANQKIVIVEDQVFKGSCPFIYTWDGQKFTFITDILLRSSLGTPQGLKRDEILYSFPNSSQEYLKIPGEKFQESNGVYSLQITEELWEVAYLDQVKLMVVDHPDSIDVYIDEKFIPPPYPPLKFYPVSNKRIPKSAIDEQDNNLLPEITERDHIYISNFTPTRFQGITKDHELILELNDLSNSQEIYLYLTGWIFPTDASINMAISQSKDFEIIAPYLQVMNNDGDWQTVIEDVSFPLGKEKTVILDLTNKFLSNDYRVRICTNMQIYWDQIFYTTDKPKTSIDNTTLSPLNADLHYRGFSRITRFGQHGSHWFDYNDVSVNPKWRNPIGNYTRYGEVTQLLQSSDDQFVIMNSGDEISIKFDATNAPPLKMGWSRDFVIYSDGWIKEGDLNTAFGKTVEPLPFHGMASYPYGKKNHYPLDLKRQEYLAKYNTRKVTAEEFSKLIINLP
jgi:tetratricopeptide (TPR) repeat protein